MRDRLALLTIVSFVLGLAGGIYLLLPTARKSCQPMLLLIANAYIAFFYIFFLPNTVIVFVAFAEMLAGSHGFVSWLEKKVAHLDTTLFLGQLPICVFIAKRLLIKSSTLPLSGPNFQL